MNAVANILDELPEAEAGAAVLREINDFLARFVSYPDANCLTAHVLWCTHAHLMDAWESTPRLAFLSPEPGSGKTRALEVTELLVPRPVAAVNVSPAYLFRKVSDPAGRPTILFDEIDTVFGPKAKEHEEVRGVLNAGHRRGAIAGRCVIRGKNVETEELPAYCAVALAGLGNLPDTILTRSVVIPMRKRAPNEAVEPFRHRLHAPTGHKLRDRLAAWCARTGPGMTHPELPAGVEDRDADVWEPLIAIADAAGDEWPELARVAAVAHVARSRETNPSLGVRLLADLRAVFGARDSMRTEEILTSLHGIEESPWADLKGHPLDSRRLANLLRPYGVRSKVIRDGRSTPRGYAREDLHDPWIRYLSRSNPSPETHATSATSETDTRDLWPQRADGASRASAT